MKVIITTKTMFDDRLDDESRPKSAVIPVPAGIKDTPKFLGMWLSSLPNKEKNLMRFERRMFIADDGVTRERIDHYLLFGEEDSASIKEGSAAKFVEISIPDLLAEFDDATQKKDKAKRAIKRDIDKYLSRGDVIQRVRQDVLDHPEWFSTDSGIILPN